jgi:hypothetical protein
MDLKPGSRWKSALSDVEVVVVRPPSAAGVLACGGAPMLPHAEARPSAGAQPTGASQAGKRYHDAESGLEALCSRGGAGVLAFDGRALPVKDAKKLPASD